MKSQPKLDIDPFPPFAGFPKECVSFLKKLKKNNNRDWFNVHKSEYEDFVKLPMRSFIVAMKQSFLKIAPEIDADPKRSMFRIYRDTRFSKNKLPYKTHVAAVFHLKGHWQGSAGFYVHVEPGAVYAGGGIYMPDSNQLKLIRKAIVEKSGEFRSIVEGKAFKKRFKSLEGEKLQRAPLGFSPDHPMVEWLKYKSFFSGVELKENECYSPKFQDMITKVYSDLLPLVRFLNESLKKS